MNVTSTPARSASDRATASDADEKSSPVIVAPSRESETVSVPMWHCRWMPRNPPMSPSRGTSNRTTSLMNAGSRSNRSSPYSADAAWSGARSSQFARLTSR